MHPPYYSDPTQFAHLHVHDEYSLLDGFATVEEYAQEALKQGWKHVAITNHGMMGGIPRQFKACENKLVAIYGCEVYINDLREYRHYNLKDAEKLPLPDGFTSLEHLRERLKQNYHLTILAKNPIGFQNLIHITSDGWINGFYRRPHVTRDIVAAHKEGLVVGTACMSGLVSREIYDGNYKLAREHLIWFKETFKNDFFVEIMLLDIENHDKINVGLITLMNAVGIDPMKHLVITNDSHYVKKEDSFFQNVMLLLQRKQTFRDKRDPNKDVFQFDSLDLWYKSVPELDETYLKLCEKYPEFAETLYPELYRQAKLNTVHFASKCEYTYEKDDKLITTGIAMDRVPKFPRYCPPKQEAYAYNETFNYDSDKYLEHLTYLGLKEKKFDNKQEYIDRVEIELNVIRKKKYSDYFLIVRDIVRFAKDSGIPVGPGRGCFLPGNKVSIIDETIPNYIPQRLTKSIEDIQIGDTVRNFFYGKAKVIDKLEYDIDEEVVELDICHNTGHFIINCLQSPPSNYKETLADYITTITCTLDHKILTTDGWKQAQKLISSPDVLYIGATKGKLLGSRRFHYTGKVYDLTVDTDDHSYSIDDIVVHNSAAGSLLCYCLGITDVDPLRHALFFERFLNEAREDVPDIDIDFAPFGRDAIKQYIVTQYDNEGLRADIAKRLKDGYYNKHPKDKKTLTTIIKNDLPIPEKYQEKRTCFIGTYGSFQTKMTVLDVCRAYDVPLHLARATTKQLLNDVDELDINEIFSIPDYKRVLSLLDIKNKRKSELFYAEKNDIADNGTISKITLLNNLDGITQEQVDTLWVSLIEHGVINEEGHVEKIPDSLPIDEQYESDLISTLQHANYVTPLESVWKIRNRQKNISQHAAGVIISNVDLKKYLPLMTRGDLVLSSWIEGKKATELSTFGFVKWDILGLLNLIYIEDTITLIKEQYKGKQFKRFVSDTGNKLIWMKNVNFEYIDNNLNDPEIYKDLRLGKSSLIFQFESPLMRKLLKESDCDNFECLTAITALGRPGPLQSGMTEEFCFRKRGLHEYEIHPVLQETLDYSYGIVIYQEQIMQIVNILAGYSLAETDNFRKVLIKVKKDVVDENAQKLEKYRKRFIEGGQQYMTVEQLEQLFADFMKWSAYGFNRCLTGDTVVLRASGNQHKKQETTIKDLYFDRKSKTPVGKKYRADGLPQILAMKEGRIKVDKIKDIIYTGKQPVYKIKTSLYEIKATLNHRFLSATGWKTVSEFQVGDEIAVNGKEDEKVYRGSYRGHKGVQYSRPDGLPGFGEHENNPGYIDGRSRIFNDNRSFLKQTHQTCQICNKTHRRLEAHHIELISFFEYDYTKHNDITNLILLCPSCHKILHYEMGRTSRHQKGKPVIYIPIKSIEYAGEEDTYDLEMYGEEHNFIANGFVSHNSHAVSYTIVSYRCAWLKTYFPLEYICSVLRSTNKGEIIKKGRKTNKYEDYIHEAQRLGLSIKKIDINYSLENFSAEDDKTIRIGFSNIKGVTEASSQDITKNRPFTSFQDFIDKMKKLPKRLIEPLILVGAFDNLPEPIGRVEAYLRFAQYTKIHLGKQYEKFLKTADKDVLSKKMASIIRTLAIHLNVKVENLTDKFFKGVDLSLINFGKVAKTAFDNIGDDIWDKLVEFGYLDEYGKPTEKYYSEDIEIGLSETITKKIKTKIHNIDSTKLELTKEECDEFFADIFGFSLDHIALDKKVGIAKQLFNDKMQSIIGMKDNVTSNGLKKIMEIKEDGFGKGVALITEFEERLTVTGSTYCAITLEDGYGEENRMRVFCWGESYKQYGKLIDIRDPNDCNRIKYKDRIIYFDVVQDKNFKTFTPKGCPSFFKFGITKSGELCKDTVLFINAIRKLKDIRIEKRILSTVQDIVGYVLEVDDDIESEQIESISYREGERGEIVEGMAVGDKRQMIAYIAGIRECRAESKKKHDDLRIKKMLSWIDLTLGDYTGSFDVRIWKSMDYVGDEEVLDGYDFRKTAREIKQDLMYNEVKKLHSGMMVRVGIERMPDYKTVIGDDQTEVIKKTFILHKVDKVKDVLQLLKGYENVK